MLDSFSERPMNVGLKSYDVGIKRWTKAAEDVMRSYGKQSVVEYPSVVPVGGIPLLTGGAYTCYAGIARSPSSGLYIFHLYQDDAYRNLVQAIGDEPIAGMVGGIPLKDVRKSPNQFLGKPFTQLNPKDASLGGFNLMVIPDSREVLYAAGYFNANEIL